MEAETGEQESVKEKETKKECQVDPSIQCLFSRKPCKRKRLKGFDFCHKHILEDKDSPFQQCSFIIKSTDDRCTNPAPKALNKKTFCLIHTRDPKLKKAHDEIMRRNQKRKLASRKAAMEQRKASADASTSTSRSPMESKRPRQEEAESTKAPEMDGIYKLQDNGGKKSEMVWFDENESDAESVDSEEEDPLRHADVWTVEEALKICRDKMIRKRSLYLEQYKRLTQLLKERRRKHLLRMAGVYPTAAESSNEIDDEPSDERLSETETRALGLYQHMNGVELLLERQAREKRCRGLGTKMAPINRCHHSADIDRCPSRALPFTKFCMKHICFDPDQKLFKKCTFQSFDSTLSCETPVIQISRVTTCDLHATLLPRFPSEGMENILHPEKSLKSEVPDNSDGLSKTDVDMKCDGENLEEKKEESTLETTTAKQNEPSSTTTSKELSEDKVIGGLNDGLNRSKSALDPDTVMGVENTGSVSEAKEMESNVSGDQLDRDREKKQGDNGDKKGESRDNEDRSVDYKDSEKKNRDVDVKEGDKRDTFEKQEDKKDNDDDKQGDNRDNTEKQGDAEDSGKRPIGDGDGSEKRENKEDTGD